MGILIWLKVICTHYKIGSGDITLGLDGQVALDSINLEQVPGKTKDYDMVILIQHTIKCLSIKVNFRWVEGHQDEKTHTTELDVWARLNILANDIAKEYWKVNSNNLPISNIKMNQYALFYNQEWLQYYHT